MPVSRLQQIIRRNFGRIVVGMPEAVADLGAQHELVLLSDHGREWVDYILARHPFLRCFRHAFFSFQLGQTKRERSTFTLVLERIGRPPEECFFVDDNAANVATAREAGISGWRFTSATELRQMLKERGLSP